MDHLRCDALKIVHLYVPVLVCVLFVLCSVANLNYYRVPVRSLKASDILPSDNLELHDHYHDISQVTSPHKKSFYHRLPQQEKDKDIFSKTWVIIASIGIVFLFLLCGTISIGILYKHGFSYIISTLSMIPFVVYLGIFPLVYIQELFYTLNVAIDWFLVGFFLYNQTVVGFIVLFYEGPKWIKKLYHIIISAMLALLIIKFVNEWIEVGLMALLICWDFYAVLHPSGPLNDLLKTLQTSKGNDIPPVIFQMCVWRQMNSDSVHHHHHRVKPIRSSTALDTFEIGLGDFIFYSVLVAKSFLYSGLMGAIFSLVCLILGITITLIVLIVYNRTLPAIPVPVTLGLLAQLATQFVIAPFADQINWQIILI